MPEKLRRARRLAAACAFLGLAVVGISAYMRLKAAGFGCDDWPACYGRVLQLSAPPHEPLIRLLHRVVATLALICALGLVWTCRGEAGLFRAGRAGKALVALMLVLAVVGPFSADPRLAVATLVNILGGILVVVLAWRARQGAGNDVAPVRAYGPAALATLLLAATMLAGALIASRYAALACPTLPGCDGPAGLVPWLEPVREALRPGDPSGVVLHLIHRYAALCGLAVLLVAAWQQGGRTVAVLAIALLEALVGALMVGSGFGLSWAVIHATGAAMLATAIAGMHERPRTEKSLRL